MCPTSRRHSSCSSRWARLQLPLLLCLRRRASSSSSRSCGVAAVHITIYYDQFVADALRLLAGRLQAGGGLALVRVILPASYTTSIIVYCEALAQNCSFAIAPMSTHTAHSHAYTLVLTLQQAGGDANGGVGQTRRRWLSTPSTCMRRSNSAELTTASHRQLRQRRPKISRLCMVRRRRPTRSIQSR